MRLVVVLLMVVRFHWQTLVVVLRVLSLDLKFLFGLQTVEKERVERRWW